MIIFRTIAPLRKHLDAVKSQGIATGFVPTMGALHAGHLSLIAQAQQQHPITISSIFVNPTQFNDAADFDKYPITVEQDILLLEKQGCDMLFLPTVKEMYPNGTALHEKYGLGYLEHILEGKYRPGHYQGVCQVVERLLAIVQPTSLFLGQKDYQQCMVLQKMTEIKRLSTTVSIGSTLREANGLAMSSRNMRLSAEEKALASAIYRQLTYIKEHINAVSFETLQQTATQNLLDAGFKKVDYVQIADAATLLPATAYDPEQKLVVLAAAFMGEVRLIDNIIV